MILARFLLAALTVLLCGSSAAAAQCSVVPEDSAKVTEVIRQVFVAAANDDFALWHRLIVPEFYAYDGGKRFEGDSLMQLIRDGHAAGTKWVWSVTDPQVHLGCDDAWINYVNRGSIETKAGITPLTWLESANLRKLGGEWKIEFIHSTRVPATQ